MGKRVLITGLGTFWGSRVAQALEADPTVDVIVGLDRKEPTVPLERTARLWGNTRVKVATMPRSSSGVTKCSGSHCMKTPSSRSTRRTLSLNSNV